MSDELFVPEELAVGTELPAYEVRNISPDHILLMALALRDPNPIHLDAQVVESMNLGTRLINQGGTSLAYIYNMLTEWAGSRAAVRRLASRFETNVFVGEDVTARGVISAVCPEEGGFLVDCEIWLENSVGARAISGSAAVFFKLR